MVDIDWDSIDFDSVDEQGFRLWLKDGKQRVIDNAVKAMVHLKKCDCYSAWEYDDYHPSLLFGIIEDLNGFYNNHEISLVAIEVANILGRDYHIYGSD